MAPPVRHRRNDDAPAVRARRYDRLQLPAQLGEPQTTAEGYRIVPMALAVPGVMPYVNADGSITREYISPEELHHVDSLTTLGFKPATLTHPAEDVGPENVADLQVGTIGQEIEILQDTGHIRVSVVISRADAIAAIDTISGVSPGYTCEIDPTPGTTPDGEPYDAKQLRRRYNHVAVGVEARGGPTVLLRADHDDRCAVRRMDAAAPGGQVERVIRVDARPTPTPTPTPAPPAQPRGPTMTLATMLTLAAVLGLGVTRRADGKLSRNDAELSEEELTAAVIGAIQELIAAKEAALAAPAEGGAAEGVVMSAEEGAAMRQENQDLKDQLAAMQGEQAAEIEKQDRARLDELARRLNFNASGWTDATTAEARRLALAQAHCGIGPDVVVRSDAAPTGIEPLMLRGAISTLDALTPATGSTGGARTDSTANPWGSLSGANDGAPPVVRVDAGTTPPPADPFKAALAARRANPSATT